MSDSACKLVLTFSCGQSFPPVLPMFFRNVTGMYEFRYYLKCDVLDLG